jgi:hypothetical protein
MSPPPEILFHRWFLQRFQPRTICTPAGDIYRPYKGKKDLATLPAPLESLLTTIQSSFNEALRDEKDIAEHVPHSPFYLDYIDSDIPNAFAFHSDDYSFIGITIGLANVLWETCLRLSRSRQLANVLGIEATSGLDEPLHVVLLRIQLNFVVTHEYTHHVHGHLSGSDFVDEIGEGGEDGNLIQQILEVDADGYAAYHVLHHLTGVEGRSHAVKLLKLAAEGADTQDQRLFSCFVAAVGAYLFSRPPAPLDKRDIYELTHPPQAARMDCLMQRSIAWCKQNRPELAVWMGPRKFQSLMGAVADATWGMNGGRDWTEQTEFLRSEAGAEYFKKLDKGFKSLLRSL